MRSKSEYVLLTMIVFLLIVAFMMFRKNQSLKDELTLALKNNLNNGRLVVQKTDSIVILQTANSDLNRSFIVASQELRSCAKLKNILKQQSLLIKTLQEQFPQHEANTKSSHSEMPQLISKSRME